METYTESTYVLFNLSFINKIYIYLLRFEQVGIWDKKNL